MTISRRSLLATSGAAAAGSLLAPKVVRGMQAGVDGSKSATLFLTEDDGLKPPPPHRASREYAALFSEEVSDG